MIRKQRYLAVLASTLALLLVVSSANAQFKSPVYTLTDAERQELSRGRDDLAAEIAALKEKLPEGRGPAARIPDAEVYLDAVDRNLRVNQFFGAGQVKQARACLAEGRVRVEGLARGETPWLRKAGVVVVLGHRSAIDGSAQPFELYVPKDFRFDDKTPVALDIFLHGRGGNLNELTFLTATNWLDGAFVKGQPPRHLVLYPYGRGNNGWRFAGEQDLFEALDVVKHLYPIDEDRIALRGFSMGGHGAWHTGLQHPGLWSVVSPGAGFTETKQYLKIGTPLPAWQDALLHLYDPIDYAFNARNVPVLAYAGDKDPAANQHKLMLEAAAREQAPMREFVGKDTEHKYEPFALAEILRVMAEQRRQPDASSVEFVTYSLRFPTCKWVTIEGLEQHWSRAEVRAQVTAPRRIDVHTRNVSSLTLTPPPSEATGASELVIDDQPVRDVTIAPGQPLTVIKQTDGWRAGKLEGLRKCSGLSGPIDDALFGPVLAVTGTGTPWTPSLVKWTDHELQRARDGWDEFFRGRLRETTDQSLTPADIACHNLYVFGDPGSNAVLRRLLPKLPIQWTKDSITVAGQTFPTASHLPMLVFPNPENPACYIVVNCGFSFSRADWQGSNARQYPHLPDWAVVRYDAEKFADGRSADTVVAGFFDERWGTPAR